MKKFLVLSVVLMMTTTITYAETVRDAVSEVDKFIFDWQESGGGEYRSDKHFFMDLCTVLDVETPESPRPTQEDNTYVFGLQVRHKQGRKNWAYIGCFKENCFAVTNRQGSFAPDENDTRPRRSGFAQRETPEWHQGMMEAKEKLELVIHDLPAGIAPPPFLLVIDAGYCIDRYEDMAQTGVYRPYPNPAEYRLFMDSLRNEEVRKNLRAMWTNPYSLDPSWQVHHVTHDIAKCLGRLADSLSENNTDATDAFRFFIRCVIGMVAEDLPGDARDVFTKTIKTHRDDPTALRFEMAKVWDQLSGVVPQFREAYFTDTTDPTLTPDQIELLIEAADRQWLNVDPTVIGTMLGAALDGRDSIGAYYTNATYVERVVTPTVLEPLRNVWKATLGTVRQALKNNNRAAAIKAVVDFHHRLCTVTVLDPACGGGNFLSGTLTLLRGLESEVFSVLKDLGVNQRNIERMTPKVSPSQLRGIDIESRAVEIARLTIWIADIQSRLKFGLFKQTRPFMPETAQLECRDAILAWDAIYPIIDQDNKPVMRWDGKTRTRDTTTGRLIRDKDALVPEVTYANARPADPWPQADFIIGNPPFIGSVQMNAVLGNGYCNALKVAYPMIPRTVDYSMYFWSRAAMLVREGQTTRFGLIGPNTITQPQSRSVIDAFLNGSPALHIRSATVNLPWWRNGPSAASVDTVITVLGRDTGPGVLHTVIEKHPGFGHVAIKTAAEKGVINSRLSTRADVSSIRPLRANEGVSGKGVVVNGPGFIVTKAQAAALGLGRVEGLNNYIKPYRNGMDVARHSRDLMILDFTGLLLEDIRNRFPESYQHLKNHVKPDRDAHHSPDLRDNWHTFEATRPLLREMSKGLSRRIVTPETSVSRFFIFQSVDVVPDSKLVVFALEDAFFFGVMQSDFHMVWAKELAGSRGNGTVYSKTVVFDTFPFPVAAAGLKAEASAIAEELHETRQSILTAHPDLTLAALDQMVQKARTGIPSRTDEKIEEVTKLAALYDDLTEAVARCYGLDSPPDDIFGFLAELNAKRAAEEAQGIYHPLRPDKFSARFMDN